MTFLARQAFAKMFHSDPDDLDMHVIYDVSHNIAKVEEHFVDGKPKTLLVRLNCYTSRILSIYQVCHLTYQLKSFLDEFVLVPIRQPNFKSSSVAI